MSRSIRYWTCVSGLTITSAGLSSLSESTRIRGVDAVRVVAAAGSVLTVAMSRGLNYRAIERRRPVSRFLATAARNLKSAGFFMYIAFLPVPHTRHTPPNVKARRGRMRFIIKLSLIVTVAMGLSVAGMAEDHAATSGTGPSFKYLGPLALGPDGVVFAADSQ